MWKRRVVEPKTPLRPCVLRCRSAAIEYWSSASYWPGPGLPVIPLTSGLKRCSDVLNDESAALSGFLVGASANTLSLGRPEGGLLRPPQASQLLTWRSGWCVGAS